MATSVMGSPLKKVFGETCSLTTTAYHLLFKPTYHEVMMYCSSAWRMGIAPKLASVKLFATTYTDYTSQATDRVATTHVPLDGMTTAKYLYMGVTDPVRGFYFTIDGTNKNANAATLDVEYCYDVSKPGYLRITGTISGALTVAETVTGGTSGATATLVYSGATYIVVKSVVGSFQLGETVSGATQTCSVVTAIAEDQNIGYFTDVASDSDGTDTTGATMNTSGLYSFTLPAVARGSIATLTALPLYWYRFAPSATLSATVDIVDIIPATDTVNYGYMEGGVPYDFSLNVADTGAFEFDHTASGTLNITWVQH